MSIQTRALLKTQLFIHVPASKWIFIHIFSVLINILIRISKNANCYRSLARAQIQKKKTYVSYCTIKFQHFFNSFELSFQLLLRNVISTTQFSSFQGIYCVITSWKRISSQQYLLENKPMLSSLQSILQSQTEIYWKAVNNRSLLSCLQMVLWLLFTDELDNRPLQYCWIVFISTHKILNICD